MFPASEKFNCFSRLLSHFARDPHQRLPKGTISQDCKSHCSISRQNTVRDEWGKRERERTDRDQEEYAETETDTKKAEERDRKDTQRERCRDKKEEDRACDLAQ